MVFILGGKHEMMFLKEIIKGTIIMGWESTAMTKWPSHHRRVIDSVLTFCGDVKWTEQKGFVGSLILTPVFPGYFRVFVYMFMWVCAHVHTDSNMGAWSCFECLPRSLSTLLFCDRVSCWSSWIQLGWPANGLQESASLCSSVLEFQIHIITPWFLYGS